MGVQERPPRLLPQCDCKQKKPCREREPFIDRPDTYSGERFRQSSVRYNHYFMARCEAAGKLFYIGGRLGNIWGVQRRRENYFHNFKVVV